MAKNFIEHGAAALAALTVALSSADTRAEQYFVRGKPQSLPEQAMGWRDAKHQPDNGEVRYIVNNARGLLKAFAHSKSDVLAIAHCPEPRLFSVNGVVIPTAPEDDASTAVKEDEVFAADKAACESGTAICAQVSPVQLTAAQQSGDVFVATVAPKARGTSHSIEFDCDAGTNGDGTPVRRTLTMVVETVSGVGSSITTGSHAPATSHPVKKSPSDASLHLEAALAGNIPTSDNVDSSISPGVELAIGVEPSVRTSTSFLGRIVQSLRLAMRYRYRAMDVATQTGNDGLIVIPDAASHIIQAEASLSPAVFGEKVRFGVELNAGGGIAFAPEVDATNGARLTSTQAFVWTIGGGLSVEGNVGGGDDVFGLKVGGGAVISQKQDEFPSASITVATYSRF